MIVQMIKPGKYNYLVVATTELDISSLELKAVLGYVICKWN